VSSLADELLNNTLALQGSDVLKDITNSPPL